MTIVYMLSTPPISPDIQCCKLQVGVRTLYLTLWKVVSNTAVSFSILTKLKTTVGSRKLSVCAQNMSYDITILDVNGKRRIRDDWETIHFLHLFHTPSVINSINHVHVSHPSYPCPLSTTFERESYWLISSNYCDINTLKFSYIRTIPIKVILRYSRILGIL